jgi:hypothetical protein
MLSVVNVRGCQESIQLSGAVRGTRSVLQLAGAYVTKTNKLKKRKETRATARAK